MNILSTRPNLAPDTGAPTVLLSALPVKTTQPSLLDAQLLQVRRSSSCSVRKPVSPIYCVALHNAVGGAACGFFVAVCVGLTSKMRWHQKSMHNGTQLRLRAFEQNLHCAHTEHDTDDNGHLPQDNRISWPTNKLSFPVPHART